MTKQEIIAAVKQLDLPTGSYIVFGSCPLAVAGIRESSDVDMLVSSELRAKLKEQGWQEIDKGPDDKPLAQDVFEVHDSWEFDDYHQTLEQLLKTAQWVEGIPFASLDEVRKWKVASGRDKDIRDVAMIDAYLAKKEQ